MGSAERVPVYFDRDSLSEVGKRAWGSLLVMDGITPKTFQSVLRSGTVVYRLRINSPDFQGFYKMYTLQESKQRKLTK